MGVTAALLLSEGIKILDSSELKET